MGRGWLRGRLRARGDFFHGYFDQIVCAREFNVNAENLKVAAFVSCKFNCPARQKTRHRIRCRIQIVAGSATGVFADMCHLVIRFQSPPKFINHVAVKLWPLCVLNQVGFRPGGIPPKRRAARFSNEIFRKIRGLHKVGRAVARGKAPLRRNLQAFLACNGARENRPARRFGQMGAARGMRTGFGKGMLPSGIFGTGTPPPDRSGAAVQFG